MVYFQVKTQDVLSLDVSKGERALLLKDYYGDWGVCLGRWEGYKKGVPGKTGGFTRHRRVCQTCVSSLFNHLDVV